MHYNKANKPIFIERVYTNYKVQTHRHTHTNNKNLIWSVHYTIRKLNFFKYKFLFHILNIHIEL